MQGDNAKLTRWILKIKITCYSRPLAKYSVCKVNVPLRKNVRRKLEENSTNNDEYNCTNSPSGERQCLFPFLAIGHPDRWSAFPDIVHKCVVFHFNIVSSAWLIR